MNCLKYYPIFSIYSKGDPVSYKAIIMRFKFWLIAFSHFLFNGLLSSLFLLAISTVFTQVYASEFSLQGTPQDFSRERYHSHDKCHLQNKCQDRFIVDRYVDRLMETDTYLACSSRMNQFVDDCHLHWFRNFFQDVMCDYSIYYGEENLINLGKVFVAVGVMANTNIDHSIHKFWQKNIRSAGSDRFFRTPCRVGKFSYWRVYIISTALGYMMRDAPESSLLGNLLYEWGYRSFRILLLVSPQELFFSWALGNGRPSNNESSRWRPFKYHEDNAGCSGHAFNGAIPFLSLATLTDNLPLKYSLYAVSTLPGLSRINADKHYFSQFVLGWTFSFLSMRAVENSIASREECFNVGIIPKEKGAYIFASRRF